MPTTRTETTTARTTRTTEGRSDRRTHAGLWPRSAWLGIAISLVPLACAPKEEKARPPKPPVERPLLERKLVDLVPPVRLAWALHARPQAILSAPLLESLRETWMGSARRKAFRHVTGVDLERVPEAWIVSYELGTLYLLPKSGAEAAESTFTARSQFAIEQQTGHSALKFYRSSRDNEPHAFVVSPFFVAFVDRDPTLGRLIALKSLGKLDDLPSSLDQVELEAMSRDAPSVLASVYFPGPLLGATDSPSPTSSFTASLLSIQADIRISAQKILVRISLKGAFGSDEDATLGAMRWLEASLGRPEFGSFGLNVAAWAPATCTTEDELNICQLLMSLDPETLNDGLLRLLSADLSAF